MKYIPSWTHNTSESFRRRLKQYAKNVDNGIIQNEKLSAFPPALIVGMPQHGKYDTVLSHSTNLTMSQ